MRLSVKTRNLLLLTLCGFAAVSWVPVLLHGLLKGAGAGQLGSDISWSYLRAFTPDSNVLCGLFSLPAALRALKGLREGRDAMTASAARLQYIGSGAACLTFVTVLVFLAPMQALKGRGYLEMFSGDMFFFHFLNPLVSACACVLLTGAVRFERRDRLLALLPTVVYSLVYTYAVVFARSWQDFYGFTFGGRFALAPLMLLAMYAASCGINALLCKGHNGMMNNGK